MKRILILIALLLSSLNIYAENQNETGFNQICQIYTAALNSHMSIKNTSQYIFSNIAQRVKSKKAIEAHEAVMQLDSSQRYKVFKQSAKITLKHDWSCPAMKKLMAMKTN